MRLLSRLFQLDRRHRYEAFVRRISNQLVTPEKLQSSTNRPEALQETVDVDLKTMLKQFDSESMLHMQDMFNAGVWHGHKVGTLNDNMKWALYGQKLGTCVFDLNITKEYMKKALTFLAGAAFKGAIVMFVSTNRQTMHMVERKAAEIGEFSHTRKWEAGTLTNIKQLFDAPLRLPDVIIFLSTLSSTMEKHPGIIEAAKLAIPTIGIVDSNSEPNYITYPIPGDDDSTRAVNFYMNAFCRTIQFGKKEREKTIYA